MWFFKRKKKQNEVVEEVKTEPAVEEKAVVEEEKVESVVEEKAVAEEVADVIEEVKETVKEVVAEPSPEPQLDLDSLTVAELKSLAKERGLTGYSTLKKAELIELLK